LVPLVSPRTNHLLIRYISYLVSLDVSQPLHPKHTCFSTQCQEKNFWDWTCQGWWHRRPWTGRHPSWRQAVFPLVRLNATGASLIWQFSADRRNDRSCANLWRGPCIRPSDRSNCFEYSMLRPCCWSGNRPVQFPSHEPGKLSAR